MEITYIEINGRRYAYTSERVSGKKNPVTRTAISVWSISKQVGIVGKRGRRNPNESRLFDGGSR